MYRNVRPAEDEEGDEYEDGDADAQDVIEDEEYEDGVFDDGLDGDERESDDDYDDGEEEDGEDDAEGAGDGAVRELPPGEPDVGAGGGLREDALVRERRAEVRSLSDLPLSKLLRVQTELRRLTAPPRNDQCDSERRQQRPGPGSASGASRRWMSGASGSSAEKTTPSAQPLNWGGFGRKGPSTSTAAPVRRGGGGGPGGAGGGGGDRGGGWSSHEEWEEEEEEDDGGGWISWNKGNKKKGKGDIGSVFQISVTFLAFLAFGGYLLCLIIQAIKGGGYWNPYYYAPAAQGSLRPAVMLVTPTRAVTRRPARPGGAAAVGRKRRAADEGPPPSESTSWRTWVPSFGEEDIRLLPEMDLDRMHRALLVIAEGYASFYHKKYHRHH
ncbi:hypothetical protein ONE63_009986 [Megalurothrips usitatus]|uniref:Uncharacterized protein n=1 Tax=Megalurothrips usitatus TaxID=439358 RepID=A0AAV7XGE3_9NEOP|nr:hypothetical protein ONE63_009986 [Megalurothrips usitatus]